MYSMAKPCSKGGSTLNLALKTLFCHENSVHSCSFSVCILRPIRPVTMRKTLWEETFEEMCEIH